MQDELKLSEEQKSAKATKMLVWLLVGTSLMLFSGLLSAYLVSLGDIYWVHVAIPNSFWISTIIIILSSLPIFLAKKVLRNNNKKASILLLSLTLVLGLLFGLYQYKGFLELFHSGNPIAGGKIIDPDGRIALIGDLNQNGKTDTLRLNLDFETGKLYAPHDNSGNEDLMTEPLFALSSNKFTLKGDYLKDISPISNQIDLQFKDGYLYTGYDSNFEKPLYRYKLTYAGQYYLGGEYGKDVWVSKNSKKLVFENGIFYFESDAGRLNPLNTKIAEYQNTAASYINLFVIIHFLHVLITLLFLITSIIKVSAKGAIENNFTWLSGMNIFWHFLGVLWIFLFIFLFFIH